MVRFGGKIWWYDLVVRFGGKFGGKVWWYDLVIRFGGTIWW